MDLPTSRLTKPSLHVELVAEPCAAHSAKLRATRRRHSSVLLAVGAACLVSACTELRPPTPIAFTIGSRSRALVPARGGKVALHAGWWDKLAKSFGLSNPQDEARSTLTSLQKAGSEAAKAELGSVEKSMKAVLAAQASVGQAQATLKASKQQAADQAVAAWEQSEEDWAPALEALVAAVVKDNGALSSTVEELRNTTATLTAACAKAQAGATERATKAEAAVSELEDEAKEALAKAVVAATISLGEGAALRTYILGRAAAIAATKALEAGMEGELVDAEELTKELSALRAKRQSEEKAKTPPPVVSEAQAEKPAEPAKSEDTGDSSVGFIAAFAVAALAAFFAFKQQMPLAPTKSPSPAPVAVVKPAAAPAATAPAVTPKAAPAATAPAVTPKAPAPAPPPPPPAPKPPAPAPAPAPAPPPPAPEVKKEEAPKPAPPAPKPAAPAPKPAAPAPETKKEEAPKPGPDLKALLKAESGKK
mmetsp:Transcript_87778/g.204283  ORF Transcript_87778/g.204283 Transcript_87778/m.204283 type:complete len:479 (-) Transcript_87778:68-1504(-)